MAVKHLVGLMWCALVIAVPCPAFFAHTASLTRPSPQGDGVGGMVGGTGTGDAGNMVHILGQNNLLQRTGFKQGDMELED